MLKKLLRKYYSKLFFKQWSIGVIEDDITSIILNKKDKLDIKWHNSSDIYDSYADPCAFIDANGKLNILAEHFTTGKYDGKICSIAYDKNEGFSPPRTILNAESHFSYPLVIHENGKMYVFTENALNGGLVSYEYNPDAARFYNKKRISELPLLDSTILKENGHYWLFATLLGKNSHSQLHIYYSNNLFGPYTPHAQNPVRNNLDGTRPAGAFIRVNGKIYRPSQNCSNYYGESLTIHEVKKITETEYEEEEYMTIKPEQKSEYSFGIHTINVAGKYIVVDGQKGHFQPVMQHIRKLVRLFSSNGNKVLALYFTLYNSLPAQLKFEMLFQYFNIAL
jgi:beta-xylosidase